tara:strand:+ start:11957 stop:12328 length:372 start_codon:yes stop_codon:yes gene_type:complete
MSNEKLFNYITNSPYVGMLDDTDDDVCFGSAGQLGMSDVVHVYLQIQEGKIVTVRFKAHGSAETLAAAAYVAEQVQDQSVTIVNTIALESIVDVLSLSPANKSSALLAIDALTDAVRNYHDHS